MKWRFAVTAVAVLFAGAALAQTTDNFPDKPVRIVVASAAGGASDIVSRIVAEKLQQKFGQPFVVEAKPGANGNLAAEFVAAAPADGYTLMMGTIGAMARIRCATVRRAQGARRTWRW
jgi:tripartite-type tricarboxylate transporter receptor subunit TctC